MDVQPQANIRIVFTSVHEKNLPSTAPDPTGICQCILIFLRVGNQQNRHPFFCYNITDLHIMITYHIQIHTIYILNLQHCISLRTTCQRNFPISVNNCNRYIFPTLRSQIIRFKIIVLNISMPCVFYFYHRLKQHPGMPGIFSLKTICNIHISNSINRLIQLYYKLLRRLVDIHYSYLKIRRICIFIFSLIPLPVHLIMIRINRMPVMI